MKCHQGLVAGDASDIGWYWILHNTSTCLLVYKMVVWTALTSQGNGWFQIPFSDWPRSATRCNNRQDTDPRLFIPVSFFHGEGRKAWTTHSFYAISQVFLTLYGLIILHLIPRLMEEGCSYLRIILEPESMWCQKPCQEIPLSLENWYPCRAPIPFFR